MINQTTHPRYNIRADSLEVFPQAKKVIQEYEGKMSVISERRLFISCTICPEGLAALQNLSGIMCCEDFAFDQEKR